MKLTSVGRDTLHKLDQPLKELAYVSNHWGPLLSDLFCSAKFTDWFEIIMNKEVVYTDERRKVDIVCALKYSILIAAPYLVFLGIVSLLLFLGI